MEEKKRPVGTSILAVIHIAGGILGAIVTVFLVNQLGKNPEAHHGLAALGLPPALLIVAIVFIFGLGIASGIGMWKGRKWGWYLGSFYYMYSIIRNLNALVTIPMLMNSMPPEELANMSKGPSYYYIKHGGRVIIHLLLYLYFFKGSVREYFSLTEQNKWKPFLVELGICIGIAAVVSITVRLMN
jgi:hypothetical protein